MYVCNRINNLRVKKGCNIDGNWQHMPQAIDSTKDSLFSGAATVPPRATNRAITPFVSAA
jgi:hypothetical protein